MISVRVRAWLGVVVCTALLSAAPPASRPVPAVVRLAEQELAQGHLERAVALLVNALAKTPTLDERAWTLLARCYEQAGQAEVSWRTLREARQHFPQSPRVALALGQIILRLASDNAEAGKLLSEAAVALPREAEPHHYYAQWAYLNDKENECAAHERQALTLPALPDAARLQMYTLLGLCEDKLDRAEPAEAAFRAALAINRRAPQYDAGAALQFARFLNTSGKVDDARALLDEIVAHAPNYGPARVERAKLIERAGRFPEAVEEARAGLAGDGVDTDTRRSARSVLAKCYYALGRKDEADEQRRLIEAESPRKR